MKQSKQRLLEHAFTPEVGVSEGLTYRRWNAVKKRETVVEKSNRAKKCQVSRKLLLQERNGQTTFCKGDQARRAAGRKVSVLGVLGFFLSSTMGNVFSPHFQWSPAPA